MSRRWLWIVLGVAVVVGGVAAVIHFSGAPPSGPVEIAWDDEVCAHCRMHVSERGYAVQLQTREGEVLVFDDPGCAILYIDDNDPHVHALYFHHVEEDRWIAQRDVAFVETQSSPMGYQLGAVDRRTPNSISIDDVRARIAARAATREGGH